MCEHEKVYVETDVLKKICEISNNDIRSSLGILELMCQMKTNGGISPKGKYFIKVDFLSRLKLSLNKDNEKSIMELVSDIFAKKVCSFQKINRCFRQVPSSSMGLIFETFMGNLHRGRSTNFHAGVLSMYRYLVESDYIMRHGFEYNG